MCFIVKNNKVKIADKDITCYKVLTKLNTDVYATPFTKMDVKLGERYDIVDDNDFHVVKSSCGDGIELKVFEGCFHTFNNIKNAESLLEDITFNSYLSTFALVKAIIPKDTKYMVNDSEYVSKSIIYTQELQEKKPEDAEGHVSFETCKLLKEKGFDWPCMFYYRGDNPYDLNKTYFKENYNDTTHFLSRPTLYMAKKYLMEKFDLFLAIDIVPYSKEQSYYFYRVYRKREPLTNHYPTDFYNTPEEAENAAIVYCLTNLI